MLNSYIESLIYQYGYLVVFLGSLIEGESIILTASALASNGFLDISKIILISFFGSFFADQFLFYLGSYCQSSQKITNTKIKHASQIIEHILNKYPNLLLFTFRFVWGIRIATPFVVGVKGFPKMRFAIINFFSAIVWAIVVCCTGYFLGHLAANYTIMIAIIALVLYLCAIALVSYNVYLIDNDIR